MSPDTSPTTPLPMRDPTISNIVCGAHLNCLFDLHHIALSARNVMYNPKRFPAAVIRHRRPKATGLVFATGKLQVLGCRSVSDAVLACRRFARMLQKLGYQPRLEDFVVQNIVANADTRMLIRLEGLQYAHPAFCRYEPEIFPGLVYSIMEPKMTVLVFAGGKLVLLGAKNEGDLEKAVKVLYPVLTLFRRS